MGDRCTIADIAHWGWVHAAHWAGVEIEEFPHLMAWEERMGKRPAVDKGRNVPDQDRMPELKRDPEKADREAKKASDWVMKGMEGDTKKK